MESKKCIECGKPIRKCKIVDIEDREIHFSCIEKIRKKRWEEDYEKLKEFLASKNIILR